jgi:hypothetical protein
MKTYAGLCVYWGLVEKLRGSRRIREGENERDSKRGVFGAWRVKAPAGGGGGYHTGVKMEKRERKWYNQIDDFVEEGA